MRSTSRHVVILVWLGDIGLTSNFLDKSGHSTPYKMLTMRSTMQSSIDKEQRCIDFIYSLWLSQRDSISNSQCPLIVGLNGVQGIGKTQLVGVSIPMKRLYFQ